MSYIKKPANYHPKLKKNKLGLTRRDYEGPICLPKGFSTEYCK